MEEQTSSENTAAETTAATEQTTTTAATEQAATATTTTENTAEQAAAPASEQQTQGEAKPFLGEEKKADADKTDAPKPASEEDYLKAIVKDEALLGNDKNFQLDQKLVKAMVPEAQKLGVSPENMNKLANALAKAQIEAAREAQKARIDYFNRMKEESIKKYNGDFTQINAGIDHWFKPGGVMNNVIRNSELGADPEFLALMNYLGSKRVMDSLDGATDGGGDSGGDPNGIGGISKIW